ncbi:pseudaminic acid biosynthesis-associated methylase [Pseudorhodoplanes sp.]|uniref:pseudaminic acid biosynthesis-associated methylase n=1 Tax=Pseudorhodoplanes sp. TaxID=1934341 RepID=UPI002CFBA945|nr:pseudaminic acid biosynthesis-associated methylase [Pseudorhodoplanes sp.]HWV44141.1 pseudaminic acid biosynthesis-associated methylase [Pseudorhodoplanes sp.]
MSNFQTPQEEFWAGSFGDNYADRNNTPLFHSCAVAAFAQMLKRASGITSVLELGPNIGMNIKALRTLLPAADISCVEINAKAVGELNKIEGLTVHHKSILSFEAPRTYDLVFTAGVLIHINPDCLDKVYKLMRDASSRYVLVAEYYNPQPTFLMYRGHKDRLYKRDWAGEMMHRFPDLKMVDYGFFYHKDPVFPWDDTTWFLMEKRAGAPA